MGLIRLKVKLIDGKDCTILINDEKNIAELRESITIATDIPREEQRLIFRGKVLLDDDKLVRDYGLEEDMAIHVVRRAPPAPATSASTATANGPQEGHLPPPNEHMQQPHIFTQNLIFAQMPFERTLIFREPNQTMTVIGGIMEQLRGQYRMEMEHTLHMDRPHNNDFSINVILRGMRNQILDSPAREHFDSLCLQLRKLAWLVALIQAQFLGEIDAVLADEQLPEQREFNSIARILNAMNAYDHFDEQQLADWVALERDNEISALIDQLAQWQLEDDEHHLQPVTPTVTLRHCTSHDLSTFLMMLAVVDAKINEHLLGRHHRILAMPHNLQVASYRARLFHCFSNAMARVQHIRAHIYHSVSDLSIHVDSNEHNRLYPQFAGYHRHEEPPQAEIALQFFGSTPNGTQPGQGQATPSPPFNFNPNASPFVPHPSNNSPQFGRQNSQGSGPPQFGRQNSQGSAPPQFGRQNSQGQAPPQSPLLNSMLSGIMNIAQHFMGGPNPTRADGQPQQPPHPGQAQAGPSPSSRPQAPYMRLGSFGSSNRSQPSSQAPASASPMSSSSSAFFVSGTGGGGPQRAHNQAPPPLPQQGPPQGPPPLYRSISDERPGPSRRGGRRRPMRQSSTTGFRQEVSWGRTSPEMPSVMFIGPNPPAQLPLFTIDRFLTCASHRYRVFELDSRHNDFWNDPRTIALGLQPPPNSIAALHRAELPNQAQYMDWHANTPIGARDQPNHLLPPNPDEPRANMNGEAVFDEMEQFGRFISRLFGSIANCLAQYDSRIRPQQNISSRGFTAGSQVSGYIPVPMPMPSFAPHPFMEPGGGFGPGQNEIILQFGPADNAPNPNQQQQQPRGGGNLG